MHGTLLARCVGATVRMKGTAVCLKKGMHVFMCCGNTHNFTRSPVSHKYEPSFIAFFLCAALLVSKPHTISLSISNSVLKKAIIFHLTDSCKPSCLCHQNQALCSSLERFTLCSYMPSVLIIILNWLFFC